MLARMRHLLESLARACACANLHKHLRMRSEHALVLAGLLGLAACKKSSPTAPDAGASTAAPPSDLAWDGPFATSRGDKGVLAAVGTTPPWLGVVDFDGEKERQKRAVVRLGAPLPAPPTVHAFPDGSLAVTYVERAGAPSVAVMISADRKPLGAAVVVGTDTCATESAFFFLDPQTHKLRRWARGAAALSPDGPVFDARASLLCGKTRAFVVEPAGTSFHVQVVDRFIRIPLVDGVDPVAGGASAFYTSGDLVGVVALSSEGTLVWATLSADDPKPAVRRLNRKLAAEHTLVAADGDAAALSVLLQREGRRRCKEEDAPPAYDLFDVGREAGKVRERITLVPPASCDSEATVPELERSADASIVRWLEWKEDEKERRLKTWKLPVAGPEAASTSANVPSDTLLLDCARGCAAVAREGAGFRLL